MAPEDNAVKWVLYQGTFKYLPPATIKAANLVLKVV